MTDREMLELAAKAAGANDVRIRGNSVFVQWKSNARGYVHWNPLIDDGDALRLAVKLRLSVCQSIDDEEPGGDYAWVRKGFDGVEFDEGGADLFAATRRAIVRAAAELGKAGS